MFAGLTSQNYGKWGRLRTGSFAFFLKAMRHRRQHDLDPANIAVHAGQAAADGQTRSPPRARERRPHQTRG